MVEVQRERLEKRREVYQKRYEAYLQKEADILAGGVQSYGIGSRNLARYNADLADVRKAIAALEQALEEIDAQLAGGSRRKSVGVVYRDW